MKQGILALDDEPHMLKLLDRIITEKTPYQITTCGNSLEVPQILEENQFDLVITDLKMPGLDGMDILSHIKEKGRSEQVIIITAFGSLDTAIEALSKGVFDYITKPFKKEQIIYTVDRAMRWQSIKKESLKMSRVFDLEPYEEALAAFESEYIQRLDGRCASDQQQMAERSGISPENISRVMQKIKTEVE